MSWIVLAFFLLKGMQRPGSGLSACLSISEIRWMGSRISYHGEAKGCSFERFCPDKGSSAPVKFLEFIVKQIIVILMIYILMVYSSLEIILSSYISDGSSLPEQSHQ